MFYIANLLKPLSPNAALGTKEFEDTIRNYVLDTSELSPDQYQTFTGALAVLDLYRELVSDDSSHFMVRFTPDE